MESKKFNKYKMPIWLMVWPAVALVGSIIIYLIANFALTGISADAGSSMLMAIINIVLFIVGSLSLLLGIPSFIVGLVLVITRASDSANKARSTNSQAKVANENEPKGMSIAGMVLGIVGLLLSIFVIGGLLGVLGVIFSAIGIKQTTKRGMAIAGLVTSLCAIIVSFLMFIFIVIGASYAGVQDRSATTTNASYASSIAKKATAYMAETGEYPELFELANTNHSSYRLSDDEYAAVGVSDSGADVLYMTCRSHGVLIWYWNPEADRYETTYDIGNVSDC